MISNHLNLVEQLRPAAESLSAQIAKFIESGGEIEELASPPRNPLPPPRSKWIDPDTVLKRKPKGLSYAERQALRKMAADL